MNRVSVIIPVYNAEKYIERAIKSVCAQTYTELQIIMVDDGSSDNSGRICDEWAGKDPRIQVEHQSNAGVSAARNRGLDLAAGTYVMFVDADDWIDDNTVELLLQMAEACQADVCTCNYEEVTNEKGGHATHTAISNAEIKVAEDRIEAGLQLLLPWAVYCKLYRTELLKDVRFHKYRIAEDLLFNTDIICHAGLQRVVSVDRKLYHYFINADSAIHQQYDRKYLEGVQVEEQCYDRLTAISPKFGDINIVGCSVSMFFERYAELSKEERRIARADFQWCKRSAKQYRKALLETTSLHRKISGFLKVYLPDLYLGTLILRKHKGKR